MSDKPIALWTLDCAKNGKPFPIPVYHDKFFVVGRELRDGMPYLVNAPSAEAAVLFASNGLSDHALSCRDVRDVHDFERIETGRYGFVAFLSPTPGELGRGVYGGLMFLPQTIPDHLGPEMRRVLCDDTGALRPAKAVPSADVKEACVPA